jgi:tRNA(Ile)-lysidine synthase
MDIQLEPGIYVAAVSGGVDSMALLDLLQGQPGIKIIVAHFDHGIRSDSREDRKLVQAAAKRYGLNFVYDEGNLDSNASEAAARKARYEFLHHVRQAGGARAVITGHHQDDLLETAILNLLRGTGRRGLTSLKSTDIAKRPLLHVPKQQLIDYATSRGLAWREDATNQDTKYLRNYVRYKILPRFSPNQRQMLLGLIKSLDKTNREIDHHLINHLHIHPAIDQLDRHIFIMLPHNVAREVMAEWLRRHKVQDVSSRGIERLIMAAKTLRAGQQAAVDKYNVLLVGSKYLALVRQER